MWGNVCLSKCTHPRLGWEGEEWGRGGPGPRSPPPSLVAKWAKNDDPLPPYHPGSLDTVAYKPATPPGMGPIFWVIKTTGVLFGKLPTMDVGWGTNFFVVLVCDLP